MAKRKSTKTSKSGLFDLLGLGELLQEIYKDVKTGFKAKLPSIYHNAKKRLLLASKKVFGQKISLIGPPAVGKTSLLKILRNPEIERSELENYKKTGAGESYSGFKVSWNVPVDTTQIPFEFKVKAGLDNGGEDYIREGHWLEAVKDSSIIFYLFDFERFINPNTHQSELTRIQNDFDWIGEHVNALTANFTIIPIGNKVDILCNSLKEFRALQVEKRENLERLKDVMLESIPKGYHSNIRIPVLMSLYNKKIRNEQFADLMLAVIGEDLISLIKKCEEIDSNEEEVA